MLEKIEKYHIPILVIILLIAFLSRFIGITELPAGMHEDEAGLAYDAYSISEYGVDRYLNHFPVYFINFSGGQSALYIYILAIFIKIFGFNLFVIRLPSLILSMLAILASYFIVKKLGGTKLALLFTFLLSIYPWHIMQSRWALDCNLLSSFIAFDIFSLLYSSKPWHYIITGIVCGLTFYTYALSYMMLPAILFVVIIYLLYIKKITIKNVLIMFIPIFLLGLPLLMVQLINMLGYETTDLGFISFPRLFTYRTQEFSFSNIFYNLNLNNSNSLLRILIGNNSETTSTLFDPTYLLLIPFILYGLWIAIKQFISDIKNKELSITSILFLQFTAVFICLLLINNLQLHKLQALLIPYIFFAALSLIKIMQKSNILFITIVIILIIHFGLFMYYYCSMFNSQNSIAFNNDLISLVNYIDSKNEYQDKKVHIESDAIQQYIYVLLAEKTSPYDFASTSQLAELGYNYFEVLGFGRYSFMYYDEINSDTIYVIEDKNAFRQKAADALKEKLEQEHFEKENWNGFSIYYKSTN